MAKSACVVSGLPIARRVFELLDARPRLVARRACRLPRFAARRARTPRGPRAVDPDGRACRPESPPAHVRDRDGDAPLRRRRGGHRLPDPRHAKDGAGAAAVRPAGRSRRRRPQPPVRSDGDGPHQGQPSPAGWRRWSGDRRGARSGGGRHTDRGRGRIGGRAPRGPLGRRRPDPHRQPDTGHGRPLVLDRRAAAGRPVFVEASGNMRIETVRAYALAGVDAVSVGSLTHSVAAADVSLELELAPG